MKVLCVIGTRPEAIKMAPVIEALQRHASISTIVCATGQHREMLSQVLELFRIPVDHDLELMDRDQTLSQLTARLFEELGRVVSRCQPEWVLAQGDTTSVFVAGVTAYYRRCLFGHVEAGLRTGDKNRPFPEEANRRMATAVTDLHFAPTERARQALIREGVDDADVRVTGNTVVDAVLSVASWPYDWTTGPLRVLPRDQPLVLITAHRRESFGQPLREICEAIRDLAETGLERRVHFVYPVHLNPNVQQPVREILTGLENLTLLEPLDYASMVHLMKRSVLILTDSGGIQEEAPSLGVPVLVMRDKTERPEGVEAGLVRLVGTDRRSIVEEARKLLSSSCQSGRATSSVNPYGDGRAAERIVSALLERSRP